MLFLVSMAWVAIVAALVLRAVRQHDLLPHLAAAASPRAGEAPTITVIVPARDEEATIAVCLRSLLDQDFPPKRCASS